MVCFFSSLNFYHSISVTHHSSLITLNTTPVWHQHSISITQYFLHYLWAPYLSLISGFFFFPPVPKLTKPSGKKKKKKRRNPKQTEVKERRRRRRRKKKEKKKKRTEQPTKRRKEKKKKKSQKWSKVAARYCLWVSYVYLITILPLSYELWKLKTAKMCFQFP